MNEDFTLGYGDGTEVRFGCAATLKNEFWYFGGLSYTRQVICKKILVSNVKLFDTEFFYFRLAKLLDASLNVKRT